MTVILMVGTAATEPAHQEARAALRSRGELKTLAAHQGRADIVVGQLTPGQRCVPAEVAAAARTSLAAGVLLWASEPMIRPVSPVGSGNVVVVSPAARNHVLSALDILLGTPATHSGNQSLHRQWWSGWVLGTEHRGFDCYQSDAMGATFVHHQSDSTAQSAGLLAAQSLARAQTDARRSSLLRDSLGDDVSLVHLAPGGGHWLVHWPQTPTQLWLCSPLRMPARWSVSATLAATATAFVRLPAFPGDLMIAAAVPSEGISELLDEIPLGALDVFRALEHVIRRPTDWGFVIEVR